MKRILTTTAALIAAAAILVGGFFYECLRALEGEDTPTAIEECEDRIRKAEERILILINQRNVEMTRAAKAEAERDEIAHMLRTLQSAVIEDGHDKNKPSTP